MDTVAIKLSDSFPKGQDIMKSDVEVCVRLINIRPQYRSGQLKNCRPLSEYSWFVEEVRKNKRNMELEQAVDKAIKDMPADYEIKLYLIAHQTEVANMCITEYDEKETMEMFKRDAREEGIQFGVQRGLIETCRDLNQSVEDTVIRVMDKFGKSRDEAEELVREYW